MSFVQVDFPKQERSLLLPQGMSLAEACARADMPLDLVCNGQGTCGKCRILIQPEGQGLLTEVLACKATLDGPLRIFLNERDYAHQGQVLTAGRSHRQLSFAPALHKVFLSPDALSLEYCGQILNLEDPLLLAKLGRFIQENQQQDKANFQEVGLTLVYEGETLLDLQLGNTQSRLYGAACDIGTTTVALYIYDLVSGNLVYTGSSLNEQITHGADVISRISYCQTHPHGTQKLQSLIIKTLEQLFSKAEEVLPDLKKDLYSLILCGNTTMQHLFFGLYPGALGRSPFVSLSQQTLQCFSEDLSLSLPGRCLVTFLPLLGGFIGADTTSVLLTLPEDDTLRLMIDLGTNGEILLGRSGRRLTASTACGPALEGGSLTCGMRATDGAIDVVEMREGQFSFHCIGETEAKGICGSGIIDLIAVLWAEEVIDASGRLLTKEEYLLKKPGSPLVERLGLYQKEHAFLLTNQVYLTQKDIRQIQLAKSAICAGCLALMVKFGCPLEEVGQLVLSGAFGNHIRIKSALAIGLLPPISPERILSIGNGAGQGIAHYLLDKSSREKVSALIKDTTCYELARDPFFMEEYIKQMNFPEWST